MSGGMSQLFVASTLRELDETKLSEGIWRKRKWIREYRETASEFYEQRCPYQDQVNSHISMRW